MNTTLLLYSSILSFSGFAHAFYGILAQSQIEKITSVGMESGMSNETDEGVKYYAKRIDKWKAGNYFVSKKALTIGLFISITAGILCILNNPWWTFFVVSISGYISYLIIANIIGWYIQILSMLATIISLILIIITLTN